MAGTIHSFDYLSSKPSKPSGAVVLFGDEPFLKSLVSRRLRDQLFGDDDDTPFATFDGASTPWRDVSDELHTVSLFGGSSRLVLVEAADSFVSEHRSRLEDLVQRSKLPGVLTLDVTKWPGNTRLAKLVAKTGVAIDCRAPLQGSRGKSLDTAKIRDWLVLWGEQRHNIKMQKKAASQLLELVGPEFGLLDQELAKLALFVKPQGTVSGDLVTEVVGGWRMQSTWDMIDAAIEGRTSEALQQLDRLLMAGEAAQGLFGQISWTLRRLAAATRIYERSLRAGRRMALQTALGQAGIAQHWQAAKAENQIKRLGRRRAGQLYGWLLETDLALKGSHSKDDRARWMLERLLLRMASRPSSAGSSSATTARAANRT